MNPPDDEDRLRTPDPTPPVSQRFTNGVRGRGPKKLRGDAARAAKLQRTAAEAAAVALKAESGRRTLLRVIAYLARRSGVGRLEIPFAEVAKEPEAVLNVVGEGTPEAYLIALVPSVRIGDRVVVVRWRAWDPSTSTQPREETVEARWPGVVIGISGTHARVALDEGAPHPQVDVWVDWLEPEASTQVDTGTGGADPG